MNLRTLTVTVVLLLVALFAALNWSLITAPAEINLVVTRVSAPLGLILLAVIALLSVLYFVFLAMIETSSLIEVRRYAREVQQARKLADKAEASRFAELKKFLESELSGLKSGQQELRQHVGATVEEARAALSLEHDTLKSQHGELGQRIDGKAEMLKAELLGRLQNVEETLSAEIERAGNTLSSYIGEVEDRLVGRIEEAETGENA
ncbi:DNA cytosine methyltransferase [Oceanithermus sp.]